MSTSGRVASAPNVARVDAGEKGVEDAVVMEAGERLAVWRGREEAGCATVLCSLGS